MVYTQEVWARVQPNSFSSGRTNTLQAYREPNARFIETPPTTGSHRFITPASSLGICGSELYRRRPYMAIDRTGVRVVARTPVPNRLVQDCESPDDVLPSHVGSIQVIDCEASCRLVPDVAAKCWRPARCTRRFGPPFVPRN